MAFDILVASKDTVSRDMNLKTKDRTMMNDDAVKVKVRIVRRRRRRRRRACRGPVDLRTYVPVRWRQYLQDAFRDCDGYWFYFDETKIIGGSNDTGIVHEDTIADCRAEFACLRLIGE